MSLYFDILTTTILVVVDRRGAYMHYQYMVYIITKAFNPDAIPMLHLSEVLQSHFLTPPVVVHPESRTGSTDSFLSISLQTSKQPIRQSNDLGTYAFLPVPPLLCMLNCMTDNPPLIIKLKNKQPCKLLPVILALPTAQKLRNFINLLTSPDTLIIRPRPFPFRLATRPPADNELFWAGAVPVVVLDHPLGLDLELYIADYGDAAPC